MQCKVLSFDFMYKILSSVNMENEINRWLAQGWRIASTTGGAAKLYVFLTK